MFLPSQKKENAPTKTNKHNFSTKTDKRKCSYQDTRTEMFLPSHTNRNALSTTDGPNSG